MSAANLISGNSMGGTPVYEEYEQDIKFQQSQGVGTQQNVIVKIVRFGNMCVLTVPKVQLSGNSSNAYLIAEDPIPSRFVPAPSRQLLPDFITQVPCINGTSDVNGSLHIPNDLDPSDIGNYGRIRICGSFVRNGQFNSTGGGVYGLFNDTAVCYMLNNN